MSRDRTDGLEPRLHAMVMQKITDVVEREISPRGPKQAKRSRQKRKSRRLTLPRNNLLAPQFDLN
jgi:hypothetical protein